ncbi:hypothetical protein D3C87_1417870 [compost metagenome]
MLLDDGGPERHGPDGHADPHGVIREAHLGAKEVAHVGDGQDVGVGGSCRVGAGALEKDQVLAAGFAGRADGLV